VLKVGTEINWRHTVKNHTLVIFAINQLEHEKANFEETVRQLKSFMLMGHIKVLPKMIVVKISIWFSQVSKVQNQSMI
jgi:hypothetical protein